MDQKDMVDARRRSTPPFLLKLFYRTAAFHRPDEFASHSLPPYVSVYTWHNATLRELAYHLSTNPTRLLPNPAIGTRLAFRLVYRDANSSNNNNNTGGNHKISAPSRFVVKDLGSFVLGGTGIKSDEDVAMKRRDEDEGDAHGHYDGGFDRDDDEDPEPDVAEKTLADAKFIVGDYISCAILPPLEDGSVAPASSARSGRGHGVGEAAPPSATAAVTAWSPDDGFWTAGAGGRGGGHQSRPSRRAGVGYADDPTGGPRRGGHRRPSFSSGFSYSTGDRGGGGGGRIPSGEWRRGERLPDDPAGGRGWGRSRQGTGRW